MPPSFSDQVSVFHFTHRISSAKIRKYKIATERGMGPGGEAHRATSSGPLPTPAPQVAPAGTMHLHGSQQSAFVPPKSASPPPTADSPSMEPPAKKPKLKLTVREPEPSPAPAPAPADDTIAVSRPKREIRYRMRYDENMVLDDESLRQHSPDSSDLSSIESIPPPPVRKPAPEPAPKAAHPEYGSLMNYYIVGGDEDDPNAAGTKSPPKPAAKRRRQSQAQRQRSAQTQHQHNMTNPQQQRYAPHDPHHMPTQHQYYQPPPASRQPPPPPPPPLPAPKVELIDFDFVGTIGETKTPQTVLEMVNVLAALSAALTNFGGVPAAPSSPIQKKRKPDTKKPKSDDAIDSFLGMFDDEEDGSGALKSFKEKDKEEKNEDDESQKLHYPLQFPGVPDGPLTYGIQFIQNALKSWAQQRLQHQYAAQWQQQAHMRQYQQQQQPQRRGPGRPRKFLDEKQEQTQQNPQPHTIQIKAENTPEGVAIKAFQQVLDSGCLQINANLPQELTRALRNLYMQIDHLINQGSKNEPQWQCLSYGAQIAANKARVEQWKESQEKAQEEMARQQQLAKQQVLHQMGLPTNKPQQLTPAQVQHAHMVELERKRSMQHAAQQPYLSQHHLNPLLLGSQPPGTPVGFALSSTPGNTAQSETPARRGSTPNSAGATPKGPPKPPSPANAIGEQQKQHMEKVQMYMPGFTPRPGTQMKFSFAPANEHAVQVWGANAFPPNGPQGSNIPNRGPMSGPPVNAPAQAHGSPVKDPNGGASPTVVPSIESASGAAHQANENTDGDVEMTGTNEVNRDGKGKVKVKKEPGTPGTFQTNGFTTVNKGAVMPPSPAMASSAAAVSKTNSHSGASDMASRFPHPGAIVVDQ